MENLIEGVKVKELAVIPDERGRLMEILRRDDGVFEEFGQAYVTTAYPGVVKAWHAHRQQEDNLTVVRGMAKIVLWDSRKESRTHGAVNEFFAGDRRPLLIHIPRMVYHGFKCIGQEECIVLNIPTRIYDRANPDELRMSVDSREIPYRWERRNF